MAGFYAKWNFHATIIDQKSMLKLMNQYIYKPPCLVLLFVCSLSYTYPWRHNERLRTRLFFLPNRRTGSGEGGECVRLFQSSPPNEPRCDHIGGVVIHISKNERLNWHARKNSRFFCSDCPYCKIMCHSQDIRVTHFWTQSLVNDFQTPAWNLPKENFKKSLSIE